MNLRAPHPRTKDTSVSSCRCVLRYGSGQSHMKPWSPILATGAKQQMGKVLTTCTGHHALLTTCCATSSYSVRSDSSSLVLPNLPKMMLWDKKLDPHPHASQLSGTLFRTTFVMLNCSSHLNISFGKHVSHCKTLLVSGGVARC